MIFLIMIFLNNVWGLDISACSYADKKYDIEFNSLIKLKSVKYDGSISLPYESYKDKKYQNIFIYSRKRYLDIESVIKNCSFVRSKSFLKPLYKIFDVKELSSGSRIANIVLTFDNEINVIFGLVKKNNFYIVFPPKNFEFMDENFKKEISDYIVKWWRENKSEAK